MYSWSCLSAFLSVVCWLSVRADPELFTWKVVQADQGTGTGCQRSRRSQDCGGSSRQRPTAGVLCDWKRALRRRSSVTTFVCRLPLAPVSAGLSVCPHPCLVFCMSACMSACMLVLFLVVLCLCGSFFFCQFVCTPVYRIAGLCTVKSGQQAPCKPRPPAIRTASLRVPQWATLTGRRS